jgi:hypothetical protein
MLCMYVCLQVIEVPGIKSEYKLEIMVHQEMLLKSDRN